MGRWSKSGEGWRQAKLELVRMLEQAARERGTVTYGDVAVRVFEGRVPARSQMIMDLLYEVDEEYFAGRGFIIASLVVRSDSGIPGVGYFKFLATHLHKDVSDPKAAWLEQAEKVWASYA